jgi:hypothetical protein
MRKMSQDSPPQSEVLVIESRGEKQEPVFR